ncbi:MAG: efflux RND transporter permease subunit, partial [Bacteroidota bacterium]
MRNIIKFFIEHPTIVNLCVLLIVGLGTMKLMQTDTSYLPKAKVRFIDIAVPYPGATPEQVEEGILLKVEEELEGVPGIDRVSSMAASSLATVTVEMTEDADADVTLSLVKNAVDKINNFPRGVDAPVVEKRDVKDLAMAIAISGEISLQAKKDYADEIEKDLLNVPGISDIVMSGAPEQEIEISVSEGQLRAYGLTFDQVAAAVGAANLETFGGEIKTGSRNISVKADDKGYYARDLANIVVSARPEGGVVYLRDVADINDQFTDQPGKRYLGEEETIVLNVFTMGDENILENAEATRLYADNFNAQHEGVELVIVEDGSSTVGENISTMTSNGIAGFILVLLVLAFFLDKYLAFWVALKIPVALIGMFLLSDLQGLTINVVSLFAFVIVLGILVDDGVVIGENIFQWAKKKGITPAQAALEGTMEMVGPVLISLSTTAVAFSMFMFLPTQTGEFFSEMAFVVIAVLAIALLESFFFLPAHLAHSRALRADNKPSAVERFFNGSVEWLNQKVYQPAFNFLVTKWQLMPYATVGVFVFLLVSAFGLMGSGVVGFTFFPNLDDKAVFIELDMPPGTPIEVTTEKLQSIRSATEAVNQQTLESHGQEMILFSEVITGPRPNQGKLRVTYVNSEQRALSSFVLSNMIREAAPPIPEADNLVYGIGATSAVFGKPVSVALRGKDLEELRSARDDVKSALKARNDVKDVSDTDQAGVQEAIVRLNPTGERLGLSIAAVMNQVRSAFFGVEAQSLQRGDEEVEVWVRYPATGRTSEAQLKDMRINTPAGGSYPLSEVAYLEYGTGNQAINRLEGEREIRVEANVADISVSVPAVIGELEAGILAETLGKYPSVRYTVEGQSRESQKMGTAAGIVMPVIMLIMLALIVLAFNSFSQAILTFALYPFAFIGVILGHWIQGENLSVFSIIGTIALIGVFTNNSLVLVSTFNQLIEDGKGFFDSLREAVGSRFRPILLTTVTTVAGLAPLLASSSLPAQFLKGPAIAMAYGLSFGLFNVLFLLPALIVIVNQGRR